ncbi:hypothetical protein HK405_002434 [Cladochytrium tenue]|nr:hypothetical protein HK405_002434 [Cladochytrium tenue]
MTATTSSSIALSAARGNEITGLEIFKIESEHDTPERVAALMEEMFAAQPTGGEDLVYGDNAQVHRVRLWRPTVTPDIAENINSAPPPSPLIVFVHGGSWRVGTYLDSTGSAKVKHLTARGYTFASVNFSLVPTVTVEGQVQEVANALSYLVLDPGRAARLGIDPTRVVLMGHSSGAHVVTLLGTDPAYLARAGLDLRTGVRGVVALDGSNYNALAEIVDSPGSVAENLLSAIGTDPARLRAVSPTHHARAPNARSFLLLHVQRRGDIRQAVELAAALQASGTDAALHVFEGLGFEGHMQMLLRLGDPAYPATSILDIAAHGSAVRPASAPVSVVAFVMSQCPDAVDCESVLYDAWPGVDQIAQLELHYIAEHNASATYGATCRHGDNECLGNIQQLCVRHVYPDPRIWLAFVACQNKDIGRIPSRDFLEACAAEAGVSDIKRSLMPCIDGPTGVSLLKSSINTKLHAKAVKSCTIYVDYSIRCIRDGRRWYDCPGGSSAEELTKSICDLYLPDVGEAKPAACLELDL